jgi:nucleotide-binding universal stress UspA family protein
MINPLFQNVVILINGSEASIHASQYGIMMAKLYRCNLKAVYVVDTATLKQLTLRKFFVAEESEEYQQSLESDGLRYLKYVEELAKAKGVKIEIELRHGAIWSEVIASAEDMKANAILLGGITASGSEQRNVLTDSYQQILANASCSVLMVKEPMVEQLFKLA